MLSTLKLNLRAQFTYMRLVSRPVTFRRGRYPKDHRASLADTLIAQTCLDPGVRLVTRDDDFRQFARFGGLRLAL